MLPTVKFCGLTMTRLLLGANPFGGFSHQNRERDAQMVAYHTVDRIKETWRRAEAAGINTIVTNNESPNVMKALKEYLGVGKLQWVAQVNASKDGNMLAAIDEVIAVGCKALYIHGGVVDKTFVRRDEDALRSWSAHTRARGIPFGVAGHAPDAHFWVDSLDVTDFHAICFFNCGSLHAGKGHRFQLEDMAKAVHCLQHINKPCIAYKIMGAGRIDARMAFEHAFHSIRPTDVVNVGMHRGDKDGMVEENAALVREILGA